MVDWEKINKLTPEEIKVASAMQELYETAQEQEKLIREAYKFEIGQDRICVLKDEHNAEYLTHSGEWQARYVHQEYEVPCTAKAIFELMIADYIVSQGFHANCSALEKNMLAEKAQRFGYFWAFIERTKKEHPELYHAGEET